MHGFEARLIVIGRGQSLSAETAWFIATIPLQHSYVTQPPTYEVTHI